MIHTPDYKKINHRRSRLHQQMRNMQKGEYERHPPEIPLKLTEQVDNPFQQTNMDLFTIEGTTFLTTPSKFVTNY